MRAHWSTISALGVVLAALLFACTASAEDSYRWTDQNGRVFYGSKPPKNAASITKMKPGALSRYSSDKMLQRLGWKQQQEAAQRKAGEKKPIQPPKPASVEPGEVRIETNEKGQIVSCVVPVKNTGNYNAIEISVAFDFPDGTLVPGIGPATIAPNASADYTIPKELLPLELQQKAEGKEGEVGASSPRVIIHAVGE